MKQFFMIGSFYFISLVWLTGCGKTPEEAQETSKVSFSNPDLSQNSGGVPIPTWEPTSFVPKKKKVNVSLPATDFAADIPFTPPGVANVSLGIGNYDPIAPVLPSLPACNVSYSAKSCGVNYSETPDPFHNPYAGSPGNVLTCLVHYKPPGVDHYTAWRIYYTLGCNNCRDVLIQLAHSYEGPIHDVSGMRCENGHQTLDHSYPNQHVFVVETWDEQSSYCRHDKLWVSYPTIGTCGL